MRRQGQGSPAERIATVLEYLHEGALLVTGDPGSGKSHLLRVTATASPLPAITVFVNPRESELPLSGLSALLAALDPRAAEFAGRFGLRSADRFALPSAAADVLGLLRGLRLPPTAVLVDDIDRMDAVSRGLLGFMAGRFAGTGIRLIATADRVDRHDPVSGLPRVRLLPLTPEAALALALEVAGPDLDAGTARIVTAHSAGNAGTIVARLRELSVAQQAGASSLAFPLGVRKAGRRVARAALERRDETSTQVLRVFSIAPLAHPAALIDAGVATADELDDLLREEILEDADPYLRLANPLVRSALHATLGARVRRELHAALAGATAPYSSGLAVWHTAHAEPAGRHADALIGGATTLVDEGFAIAAVELGDLALRRMEDAPGTSGVLELVDALRRGGEGSLAERYLTRLEHSDLDHRDRSRLTFLRLQTELERTGRLPHVATVAALARYGDDDPVSASALLATGALWQCLRGDVADAAELLGRVEAWRPEVPLELIGLLEAVDDLVAVGRGDPRAREAPASLVPADGARVSAAELVARARAASLREDYDTASRLYSRVLEIQEEHPGWHDLSRVLLADNAIRASWVEEGLAAVAKTRELALPEPLLPMRVLLEAWAEVATGRPAAAAERLSAWLAASYGAEGLASAGLHALLGSLALMRGDAETAVRELSHADLMAGDADPGILRHHPQLIDALVSLGRLSAARTALERFEAVARRFPGRWITIAIAGARAVVAEGDLSGQLFDRALEGLRPDDPPLERARLLLRRGLRLRDAGASGADAALLEARAAFESMGATAWFREDVSAPPPRRSAVFETLSEPERDVALLVLQGLQNKEIAAKLFVSLRTVELRLTHIFRKTGTRSRSQLVAALS